MYTKKKRAELANICYMTVEKECSKPIEEINTALIDACIDLANKLLDIKPLSEEEILSAKKKIELLTVRRRKRNFKIRLIAAILAIVVVLATTACALSDWLLGIFGVNTLYTVQPGEVVTEEFNELEAPSDILYFDNIDDLVACVDEQIYLPMDLSEKYVLNYISIYEGETKEIEIMWTYNLHNVWYRINFNPSYFKEEDFYSYEYEHYSEDGHPFDFIQVGSCWQAMGWINNNEYIISANEEETLRELINNMICIE